MTDETTPGAPIRARRAADLPGSVELLATVHTHDGYPSNWPTDPVRWLDPPGLLRAWAAKSADGHRLLGHVALSSASEDDAAPALYRPKVARDHVAVVSRLFVAPSARGTGVASRLLAHTVREARGRGLHGPVLDVVTTDTAAVRFYGQQGWHHLGFATQQWSPTQHVPVHCYSAPPCRGEEPSA